MIKSDHRFDFYLKNIQNKKNNFFFEVAKIDVTVQPLQIDKFLQNLSKNVSCEASNLS